MRGLLKGKSITKMWDCLPDELTEKILYRLPVKSIIQCRCVCKLWRSLVTTPNFISTHFLAHTKETPQTIFVHHQQYAFPLGDIEKQDLSVSERCLLLFDNNINKEECLFRSMSFLVPGLACRKKVVGSVNGLICLCEGIDGIQDYFILFNPSIGRFLSIPSPLEKGFSGCHSTVEGLGFDDTTLDYKILYIVDNDCFIYSLNSNSWRKIISPPPPILSSSWFLGFPRSVVFLNGRIHRIHSFRKHLTWCRFIMVFNLKDDTFSRISLPECFVDLPPHRYNNRFSIHEFGESSFALVHKSDYQADVWVMKELYGSKESSWIKFATFHSEHQDGFLQVLGFRNKDRLLILPRRRSGIVSYDIHNKEEVKNWIYNEDIFSQGLNFSQVYKYVPSLVLLDKVNNFDARVGLKLNNAKKY